MQSRQTSFVTLLSPSVRRRHEHTRSGKSIIRFSVQVEVLVKSQWQAVVRYDTAHGFAHRDLIHPDGRLDKTPLFLQTFNEALDFAEADLKSNWKDYIDRYLRGVKP